MKQTFLLVLLLCIVFFYAKAGSIRGYVKDSKTGDLLNGAVLQIEGTTLYAVTDNSGLYVLITALNKTYRLRCSFLGYTSIDTSVFVHNEKTFLDIKLSPSSIDLNAVVVTASRAERKLKDAPLITQIVSLKEIEKVGAVNLEEALEMAVPGLEFQQEGYGTNIKMQGLDGKYVLVLIDGERMAGETRGNIDYSRLNTANVERIEIVRGASSTLYGSKAIGGVINIITKDHQSKGSTVSVNSRYSRFNEFSSGVTLGTGKNGWSSQSDLQYKRSDGYDLQPETPHFKTQYGYENYHLRQKFGYNISTNWKVSLLAAYYQHEQKKMIKTLKTHPLNYDYTAAIKSLWYIKEKHKLEFVLHADQYEIFRKQHVWPNAQKLEYRNRIINPRLTADIQISPDNQLSTGIEYFNDYLNGICISGDKNFTDYVSNDSINGLNDNSGSFFLNDEHRFSENLMLTLGLRTEYYERYHFHFVPSTSLKYDFSPFTMRVNLGWGYKAPTLKEMYMDYVVPGKGGVIDMSVVEMNSFTNIPVGIFAVDETIKIAESPKMPPVKINTPGSKVLTGYTESSTMVATGETHVGALEYDAKTRAYNLSNKVFVVRCANGKSYAKMKLTQYRSGIIDFNYELTIDSKKGFKN